MKAFLKKVFDELWNRVFVAYKSTIVGVGFLTLAVVLESIQTSLDGNETVWARVGLSLVGLALVFVRGKAVPPIQPQP